MVKFGYKLMTEEHGPKELVANAQRAEQAGFDFVSISDHFHPWLKAQGHSPFAWGVLGAIAATTERIGITTGLTCPILRYHPAIIAQAAATIAIMSGDRFTLAIGAGERLNEHVTGVRWPSVVERHEMLSEAMDVCRALWSGKVHTHAGKHFTIDHAQLYDVPSKPILIALGVSGAHGVALAAEKADALMATEPKSDLVDGFRKNSAKERAACYCEVTLAFAPSEEAGRKIAHERFKFGILEWSVLSELPSVEAFEAATKYIHSDDIKASIPAGPDPAVHVAAIKKAIDAGFDHIVLTGAGPDQVGFIDFFQNELRPKLTALA